MNTSKSRTWVIIVGVVLAGLIGILALRSLASLGNPWDTFYESQNEAESLVWIGVRNQSRTLQILDDSLVRPQIVDAKGYTYELNPGGWLSYPARSAITSCCFGGPNGAVIPPGGALLMSYRYSMPPNAPSPKLVFHQGFLDIGRRSVPLDRPERGFRGKSVSVPDNAVLFSKKDVIVGLARAWWDDGLLVAEIQVNNQGGTAFGSEAIGILAAWGSQAALYDPRWTGLSEEEQAVTRQKIDRYTPLASWQVPPYSNTNIYYIFVPCHDDLKRTDFIIAAYSNKQWLWRRSWQVHGITEATLLPQPPDGAHANDPHLGWPGIPSDGTSRLNLNPPSGTGGW